MFIWLINALIMLGVLVAFRNHKDRAVIVIACQMFLLLALRNRFFGLDGYYYYDYYDRMLAYPVKDFFHDISFNLLKPAYTMGDYKFETGFALLNFGFAKLGIPYQLFMVFCAAFEVGAFVFFARKISSHPAFTLFMLSCMRVYLLSFYVVRQSLALAIVLFGIGFIQNRKLFKYLLIVFVAFTIHRAALVGLLLYPAYAFDLTRKNIAIVLSLFVVTIAVSYTVLPELINLILTYLYPQSYEAHFSLNKMILIQACICLSFLLLERFGVFKDKNTSFAASVLLLGLLAYAVMLNQDILARSKDFFWIFIAVLMPCLIDKLPQKRFVYGSYVLLAVIMIGNLYLQLAYTSLSCLLPYVPFWTYIDPIL